MGPKTVTASALLISALIVGIFAACNRNTAPAISKFSVSKNAAGEPAATTFNVGEPLYAVASASTAGKYNMDFRVSAQDGVINKAKGEPVMNKSSDFDGTQPQRLSFQIAFPGTYKLEAVLSDAAGNQLDSKSEIITMIGENPKPEGDREEEMERERERDRDKGREPENERQREHDRPKQ
jgi:hypothetical protein